MTKFLKALVAVLTTILCVSPAFAQVTTSSVSGIVTDDSGAPLEGSVIVAVHTPTGSQYYAVANSAGQYFINGIVKEYDPSTDLYLVYFDGQF